MLRRLHLAWLPLVCGCGLLLGCEHSRTTRYPPDPLLLSRKPVESRPEPGQEPALARHEPHPPQSLLAAVPARNAQDDATPTSLHPDP